jgi:ribosome-binding ATPase YchF (GTP1/OBG family)
MRKLSIGIVGLPNVGKSTLFKLLTKVEVNIANYPFCTIDPNVGVVTVADSRLEALAEMSKSAKSIPAVIEFYDIAGLVKGAAGGEGLGNKFLSHIREVQAIAHVLRIFPSGEILHVESSIDPARDYEVITAELALKDLESVEKRLEKARSEAKSQKKEAIREVETLEGVREVLSEGKRAESFAEESVIRELGLLTAKREIVLMNGDESHVPRELRENLLARGVPVIVADFASMNAIPELTRAAYETLGLMSFFTTGEEETRAWTIRRGAKAPEAAGAIHTDFEKKFIRAEVVSADNLLRIGSWAKAREKGMLRLEGKDYVVQDGDVMVIRHG